MLALELFLLFYCVSVVVDEASGRGRFEFSDAAVVQLVDCLVEGVPIDTIPLVLELGVQLCELVLNRFRLHL